MDEEVVMDPLASYGNEQEYNEEFDEEAFDENDVSYQDNDVILQPEEIIISDVVKAEPESDIEILEQPEVIKKKKNVKKRKLQGEGGSKHKKTKKIFTHDEALDHIEIQEEYLDNGVTVEHADPDEDLSGVEVLTTECTPEIFQQNFEDDKNEITALNEILERDGETTANIIDAEDAIGSVGKVKNYESCFKCVLCDYVTMRQPTIESHFRRKHLGKRTDPLPAIFFIRKKRLKKNLAAKKDAEMYKCPHCDYRSNRQPNVNKHVLVVHDKKQEECKLCGKMYKNLNNHVKQVHMKIRNFPCQFCDYRAINRAYLNYHVRNKHTDIDERVNCELCGKLVKQIKVHMAYVHSGNAPQLLPCTYDYCDYKAKTKSAMQCHIKQRHEIVTVKCQICDEDVNRVKLNHHMKKHTDKIYTCLVCLGNFRERRDLSRHILYKHKLLRSTCHICHEDITDYVLHLKFKHKEFDRTGFEVPNSDKVIIRLVGQLIGSNNQYAGSLDPIDISIDSILVLYANKRRDNELLTEEDVVQLGFKPVDFHGPKNGSSTMAAPVDSEQTPEGQLQTEQNNAAQLGLIPVKAEPTSEGELQTELDDVPAESELTPEGELLTEQDDDAQLGFEPAESEQTPEGELLQTEQDDDAQLGFKPVEITELTPEEELLTEEGDVDETC